MTKIQKWMELNNACDSAKDRAAREWITWTFEEAWTRIQRGDWLAFYLRKQFGPRSPQFRKAMAAVGRLAIPRIVEPEDRHVAAEGLAMLEIGNEFVRQLSLDYLRPRITYDYQNDAIYCVVEALRSPDLLERATDYTFVGLLRLFGDAGHEIAANAIRSVFPEIPLAPSLQEPQPGDLPSPPVA